MFDFWLILEGKENNVDFGLLLSLKRKLTGIKLIVAIGHKISLISN